MADTPAPDSPDDAPKGFTLDLSTGKPPSRKRRKKSKGPAPVVQKTINLSTPKSEKPTEPKASANELAKTSGNARPKQGKSGGRRKERSAPRSAGTSLADLLDPETLARLRGGE